MDCSTAVSPVHHQLSELAQTHVHWIGSTIQPSYLLSSPSPPAFSLSQNQGQAVPDLFLTIRLFHVSSVNSWFAYRFLRRQVVWTFFGFALLWNWNENWHFQGMWPQLSFPNLLAYWCSTLTASSFRSLNSSARIPSPHLSVFAAMLPKAHLTSHFRMFGSVWGTTPLWLSRSLTPIFYSFVCSCHPFLPSSSS